MVNAIVCYIIFHVRGSVKIKWFCIYDVSNRDVLVLMEPEGSQESLELRFVF